MLRLRTLSVLALAALILALPACQTQQQKKTQPAPTTRTETMPEPRDDSMRGGTFMDGDMVVRSLAVPTGEAATSAVWLEKRAPVEVSLGEEFEYTVTVNNISGEVLQDVSVMERVPAGLTVVSSNPPHQSMADGRYSWVVGDLDPGAPATIRIRATANQLGDHVYCAEVKYNQLACVTTRVVEPNLTMTKVMTFANGTKDGLVCDPVVVTITVLNTGTGSARNVVVRDDLPSGMVADDGRSSMMWDVGTLAAGESREIRFSANANTTGDFTNVAEATADGGLNASASDSITARRPALTLDKSGPTRIFAGRQVTYEIVVRNTGNGVARDTVVEDMLPAGAPFVSASTGGTLSGNTVIWNLGTLQPDESRTMNVTVRADTVTTIRNAARATAYCAEAVSDEVVTDVQGIPAVLLEVIDLEDPVPVGGMTTYVIRVTNQGSATDSNIRIVCELEDAQQFVTATGATGHSSSGSTVTFAPLATLAPGAVAEWRCQVKAVASANVRFGVSMTTDQITRPVTETESTNLYE